MIGFSLVRGILTVAPETWGYIPFKVLLERDKTPEKDQCTMEMLFIHNYCKIGGDYEFIRDLEERKKTIQRDIGLPEDWEIDKELQAAIDFYTSHSTTVLTELYAATVDSVTDITNYLKNTKSLLKERDKAGRTITKISDITGALKSVTSIMKDVKAAYKEVVRESKEIADRNVGKQSFNTFEEGLDIGS